MLISCEECGHQVSDKAASCPNCGAPVVKNDTSAIPSLTKTTNESFTNNPKENNKSLIIVLSVLMAIALIIVISIGYKNDFWRGTDQEDKKEATAEFVVSEYLNSIIINGDSSIYSEPRFLMHNENKLCWLNTIKTGYEAYNSILQFERYTVDDYSILNHMESGTLEVVVASITFRSKAGTPLKENRKFYLFKTSGSFLLNDDDYFIKNEYDTWHLIVAIE